jgi:Spore germination B3/ GerAC like, C-terminal.
LDGREPVIGVVEMVPNEDGGEKSSGEAGKSSGGGDKGSSGGESEKKKNKLQCQGLAAFKNDKLVGYLNGEETRCYNILENASGKFDISIPYKNELSVLEKISSKSKTSIEFDDGRVNIKVSVDLNFVLNQLNAPVDVTPNTMEEMEKIINQRMADEIAAVIKKAQQEFKSDIFGFGETMHTQHPDEWRSIKQNWNDGYFSPATVSVEVTSAINRAGTIGDAFAYESD